jgi:hypothetical protein
MEIAIALKLLDLAFLGASMYQDFQEQQRMNKEQQEFIMALRAQLMNGNITEAEMMAEIDKRIGSIIGRRRAALDALPTPTGHS